MKMAIWIEQREIDLLVESGFAELDTAATDRWRRYWEERGSKPSEDYCLRPVYRWTDLGKEACHLYRYTTPMSYAGAIQAGMVRHCVHCGRCTTGRKVGSRYERGSREQRNRTVCLMCHATGKTLD